MATGTKPAWAAPLVVCCLLLILFLIAATIVLALIPVYLSTRNIDVDINILDDTISAGYASDMTNGASLTLANTDSVSTQLTDDAGIPSKYLNLQSGSFASTTASNGKKRQISYGNPTCEQATSLTGNIFVADYRIKYPEICLSTTCREGYKIKLINALRMGYRTVTIVMNFTNGEIRNVQLVFCALLSSNYTDVTTSTTGSITTSISSVTNSSNFPNCTTEARNNIYLIDLNSTLYQCTPANLNLTAVGSIKCSSSGLYAIALQRTGIIWAIFEDGSLYNYIIGSQQCISTQYATNQSGIAYFTMAFVKSTTDDNENLYISKQNDPPNVLGTIDLTTLSLSIVGNYSSLQTYADLTGTNDGRLFGVFQTDNFTIAQINATNADIIAQYPLNISSTITSEPNYGFAAYDSNFLFFSGNGNNTDIYLFDPSTNTTTMLTTVPQVINGAAVSTCYGT